MIPADPCRSVPATTGPRLVLCHGASGVANLSTPEFTPGSLRSGTGLIRSPRHIKSQVNQIFTTNTGGGEGTFGCLLH